MTALLTLIVQFVIFILKHKMEGDDEKKKNLGEKHNEAIDAAKEHIPAIYHAWIDRMRSQ